ncbi:hypothetical protein [Sphingomonas adhaesiva]|uniref:hypothetical protein n=1 Tax=Sphingomonas adhaesiva TaxID=28212 RepID=UPI002FFCD2F7
MHLSISETDLPSIKESLRKAHPNAKSSLRMEALARAVGFTTYAGLRARLDAGSVQVSVNDAAFCEHLKLASPSDDALRSLSRAIARAMLRSVLDAYPDLTLRGFDSIWQGDDRERAMPIPERQALLAERRREGYDDDWAADQFELAMIFLSRQRKIKTLNRKTGSYGLKHRAEGLSRHFGLFTHLGNYVANGMLIAAAYASGFTVRRIGFHSYNAFINISMETVRLARGHEGRSRRDDRRVVAEFYTKPDFRKVA